MTRLTNLIGPKGKRSDTHCFSNYLLTPSLLRDLRVTFIIDGSVLHTHWLGSFTRVQGKGGGGGVRGEEGRCKARPRTENIVNKRDSNVP